MAVVDLEGVIQQIVDFSTWLHVDRIKFFAWYFHGRGAEQFFGADICQCYQALNMEQPANFSSLLSGMESRRPRDVLRKGNRFVLERRIREDLNVRYGQRTATVHVHALLRDLPTLVPDLAERSFLEEAIV